MIDVLDWILRALGAVMAISAISLMAIGCGYILVESYRPRKPRRHLHVVPDRDENVS